MVGRWWEKHLELTVWRVRLYYGGVMELAQVHKQPPEWRYASEPYAAAVETYLQANHPDLLQRCLSKSNRKGISMNQPNLIIAAPWEYVPTTGAVASLLTTLERVGLVTGAPNTETPEGPSGRHGTTWTWSPGPTVAAELGAEYCEGVTLSVTDWLQPLFWPGGYECANGHRAHDLGNLALAMVATGTPPVHVCPVCGVSTSVLDLGEYPIPFMGAYLWLRFDHASDPDSMTGPALDTVRRVLGVERLEFGVFDIAW